MAWNFCSVSSFWALLLLLLSRFSRVRLWATPCTAAHQAPPSLGFSRQEHWSGLPFPSPMHESEKRKCNHSVVSNSLRNPWTAAHQAPPPMGFSRQEYWRGLPLLMRDCFSPTSILNRQWVMWLCWANHQVRFGDLIHLMRHSWRQNSGYKIPQCAELWQKPQEDGTHGRKIINFHTSYLSRSPAM